MRRLAAGEVCRPRAWNVWAAFLLLRSSNMREGAEFYRTLKGRADALLSSARDLASARSLQARELLLNLRQVRQGKGRSGCSCSTSASCAPPSPALAA